MDWWNLRAEHTQYEWAVQRVMYLVSPYGERRADIRAAYQTGNLLAVQASKELTAEEFAAMVSTMATYMTCDRITDDEDEIDHEALNMIKGE